MGPIKSKIVGKKAKRSFWGIVFHENTSGKSKFRSKGAELFWRPQFFSSIAPMGAMDRVRMDMTSHSLNSDSSKHKTTIQRQSEV